MKTNQETNRDECLKGEEHDWNPGDDFCSVCFAPRMDPEEELKRWVSCLEDTLRFVIAALDQPVQHTQSQTASETLRADAQVARETAQAALKV